MGENKGFLKSEDKGIWKKALYVAIAITVITIIFITFSYKQEEPVPSENETLTKNETLVENGTFIQEKIKSKLIGMEITYYGVAGNALVYNVRENDIKMINETLLDSKRVWKVRIGVGISWDYYFDETGENIVKIVQLFRT